jgi:hypothetical protein
LISSDYNIDRDYTTGWNFQASRSTLVPDPKYPVAITPFVLAYRTSVDGSAHPTFSMSILKYRAKPHPSQHGAGELLCNVEVYSDDMTRILEYDLCSFDLAVMRRAQVPLGNGSGLVTKYFETLKFEPFIVLLFPMFWSSNWFYTDQFNAVNGPHFDTCTKSLNGLLYWLSQIIAAVI